MSHPTWPGLHPGTGTNDHIHNWQTYQYKQGDDSLLVFQACQICGIPKGQKDAIRKAHDTSTN